MEYYINRRREKKYTAGNKAPDDICAICRKMGLKEISFPYISIGSKRRISHIIQFLTDKWIWRKTQHALKPKDIIVYQHPMYVNTAMNLATLKSLKAIKNRKKIMIVFIIHDLESIRCAGSGGTSKKDQIYNAVIDKYLNEIGDVVICHNDSMKQMMTEQLGYDSSKLVTLEMFDYLHNNEISRSVDTTLSVDIAGKISREKSGYVYHVIEENPNVLFNVYGIGFEEQYKKDNLCYKGSFTPEELLTNLTGKFGIVWDGPSITECAGNYGRYLLYNNPHKLSMFIAAGEPVIVWDKSAMASFVKEKKIGICVDSLCDLKATLQEISCEEYKDMCMNTKEIGYKLKNGDMFITAYQKAKQMTMNI